MHCILITGANRGIGLELVKQYYSENWHVIACSRHTDTIESEINQRSHTATQGKLTLIQADVTKAEDIKKISNTVEDLNIDILYNNAGVWGPSNIEFGSIQAELWLEVFRVNTLAPLLLAQALIKQIARSKLKIIVNMSSSMGSIENNTSGGGYIYRSSKAALNAVTKSLAIDLKDKEIIVVSLHPGWVKTDMGGENAPLTPAESVQGIKKVLSGLSLQDTGSYLAHNGNKLPW